MRVVAIMSVGFTLAIGPASASTFTCPATITADDHEQPFRHVSFFEGDPKDLADLAPAEGPDPTHLEQSWQLKRAPGKPIVMVCRYHDTGATFVQEVPLSITSCTLKGLITDQGEIVGSPTLTCE